MSPVEAFTEGGEKMSGKNITDNLDIYNVPVEGPVRQKILDLV